MTTLTKASNIERNIEFWHKFGELNGKSAKILTENFVPSKVFSIPKAENLSMEEIDFSSGQFSQEVVDNMLEEILFSEASKLKDPLFVIMVEWLEASELKDAPDKPNGLSQLEEAALFYPVHQDAKSAISTCRREQVLFRGWILLLDSPYLTKLDFNIDFFSCLKTVVANAFDQDGWLVAKK